MIRHLLVALACTFTAASAVQAQVLAFDNTTSGLNLSSGGALTMPPAFPQNNFYATQFTPSVSGTLESLEVLVATFSAPSSLNIYFAPDSAGLPAVGMGATTLLGSFTHSAAFGSGVFSAPSLTAHPLVAAGTPAWIVLVPTTGQFGFWQHATAPGLSAFSMGTNPDLAIYTADGANQGAMRVFVNPTAVPEPGTLLGGAGAALAVGALRLRRRQV